MPLTTEEALEHPRLWEPARLGLLYSGASTVSGAGLPMCLISAQPVLKRLTGDRSALPVRG